MVYGIRKFYFLVTTVPTCRLEGSGFQKILLQEADRSDAIEKKFWGGKQLPLKPDMFFFSTPGDTLTWSSSYHLSFLWFKFRIWINVPSFQETKHEKQTLQQQTKTIQFSFFSPNFFVPNHFDQNYRRPPVTRWGNTWAPRYCGSWAWREASNSARRQWPVRPKVLLMFFWSICVVKKLKKPIETRLILINLRIC